MFGQELKNARKTIRRCIGGSEDKRSTWAVNPQRTEQLSILEELLTTSAR